MIVWSRHAQWHRIALRGRCCDAGAAHSRGTGSCPDKSLRRAMPTTGAQSAPGSGGTASCSEEALRRASDTEGSTGEGGWHRIVLRGGVATSRRPGARDREIEIAVAPHRAPRRRCDSRSTRSRRSQRAVAPHRAPRRRCDGRAAADLRRPRARGTASHPDKALRRPDRSPCPTATREVAPHRIPTRRCDSLARGQAQQIAIEWHRIASRQGAATLAAEHDDDDRLEWHRIASRQGAATLNEARFVAKRAVWHRIASRQGAATAAVARLAKGPKAVAPDRIPTRRCDGIGHDGRRTAREVAPDRIPTRRCDSVRVVSLSSSSAWHRIASRQGAATGYPNGRIPVGQRRSFRVGPRRSTWTLHAASDVTNPCSCVRLGVLALCWWCPSVFSIHDTSPFIEGPRTSKPVRVSAPSGGITSALPEPSLLVAQESRQRRGHALACFCCRSAVLICRVVLDPQDEQ